MHRSALLAALSLMMHRGRLRMCLPNKLRFSVFDRMAFAYALRPCAECAAGEMGVRTAHQAEEKAQMVVSVRRLRPTEADDGADSGDDAAALDAAAEETAGRSAADIKVHGVSIAVAHELRRAGQRAIAAVRIWFTSRPEPANAHPPVLQPWV